ncbi:hypothetical protein TRFO_40840 [Tritrichomonas foetus]|uniref:Uncharacterized protein n=1 Tax=Tritrichomonas foetus TaxID=1144522 RepID=A0A1J4IZJ1_9EUKA|nr:hypothetical protein TRFO_40840 [Tritrichomonas foetus]|eukprot:OHS92830.1 hypothetical protein TRFO_40840 [Tritrichomonas foetus]
MVLPTSLHKFTYQATESVENLCFFFPERSSLTEYRVDSSSTVQIHDGSTESYQENYIARKSLTTDEITTIRFPNLLKGEIITITQSNPLPTYIDQCNRYTTYGIDSGDGSDTKTLEIQADSVKCTTPTETFEPSNVFSASNTFPSATEKPSNIGLIIGIVVAVVVVIVVAVVVVVCMLKKKKIQNQSVP